MSSKKLFFKNVAVCLIAVSIPLFLVVNSIQARRCALLEKEIAKIEQTQSAMVEDNKTLITGISVLAGADRIESLAGELGLKLAETEDIIRVEMGK